MYVVRKNDSTHVWGVEGNCSLDIENLVSFKTVLFEDYSFKKRIRIHVCVFLLLMSV